MAMTEEEWYAATDHRGWQGHPTFDFVEPDPNAEEVPSDYYEESESDSGSYKPVQGNPGPPTPPGMYYEESDSEIEDEASPEQVERQPFWLHTIWGGRATPLDQEIIRILGNALRTPQTRSCAIAGSKANENHMNRVAAAAAAALNNLCPSIDYIRIRYVNDDRNDNDREEKSGGGSSTDMHSGGAASSSAHSGGSGGAESIFSEVRRHTDKPAGQELERDPWAHLKNVAPDPPGYDTKKAWRTTKRIDRFLWHLWSILEIASRLVPADAVHPGQATLVSIVTHLQESNKKHGAFFNSNDRYCRLWEDLPLFYECMSSGCWEPPSDRFTVHVPFGTPAHALWNYWQGQNVFYARCLEDGLGRFDHCALKALRDGLEGGWPLDGHDVGGGGDSEDNDDFDSDDFNTDGNDDFYGDVSKSMADTYRSDVSMRDSSTRTTRPPTPGLGLTRPGRSSSPVISDKSDVSMRDVSIRDADSVSVSVSAASTTRVTRSASAVNGRSGLSGRSDSTIGGSYAFSDDNDRSGSGRTYGPLPPRPLCRSARIEAASLSASTSTSTSTVRPPQRVTRRSGRQKWVPHLLGMPEEGKAQQVKDDNKGKGKRKATTLLSPPRPLPPHAPVPKTGWQLLVATAWLIHAGPALLRLSNSGDLSRKTGARHGDDCLDPVGKWLQNTDIRKRGLSGRRWDFWKAQLAAWLDANRPAESMKSKTNKGKRKRRERAVAFAGDKHIALMRTAVERALQEMDIAEDVIEDEFYKIADGGYSSHKRKGGDIETKEERKRRRVFR